jgi:putative thioredoxin
LIHLKKSGLAPDAFEALERGDREAALDGLLDAIAEADEQTREDLRRAVIGILSEGDQADPAAREYRRRLATALY